MSTENMPLWEVFIRPRNGLHHKHVGSTHAADGELALQAARDVYTRREEGNSIWVVRSGDILASDPDKAAQNFDPASDKIYRHPSFYNIPDDVENM
jgi:ring-1,2-phenylacetyl-CoA epoxidase subunit PaaB